MRREIVRSKAAPQAGSAYSRGVSGKPFLFTSGQIPVDPTTGEVLRGDIPTRTRRVLENLKAVLASCGLEWGDVVKTTAFFTDMEELSAFNEVYAEYLGGSARARSSVGVARLPLDVAVELDMIACECSSSHDVERVGERL